MKLAKFKIYILELILIMCLLFALFVPNIVSKGILSIFMFIYMFIVIFSLKKRKSNSTYDRQVTILLIILAVFYLGVFYLLGLYYGFVRSKYLFNLYNVIHIVIPVIITIVSTEIMRKIFLSQPAMLQIKSKKINLSLGLVYIAMTLVDMVIYSGIYDLGKLDDFLMVIGFILFASLSSNLLYNYITASFGYVGIIIYRIIITIYMYVLPYVPDVYILLQSFLRMLYPFIIYVILESTYAKGNLAIAYKDKKKNIFMNLTLLGVMSILIMLISCRFKYGIIVIGSESMVGSLDKGDAVIYEKYDDGIIQKGQTVVFNYNDLTIIHRVVDVRIINGEVHYITKGDANKDIDEGTRSPNSIIGCVKLRIKYVGLPTLWLREVLKGN